MSETKLNGTERLMAEHPLVFELAAQIRQNLADIDQATDIQRLLASDASDEDLNERARQGRQMGEALRQELDAIGRNLANVLACYEPAPFLVPAPVPNGLPKEMI